MTELRKVSSPKANNQFNRDDIYLHLFVVDYDESKRYDLSNDPDIKIDPLGTFALTTQVC